MSTKKVNGREVLVEYVARRIAENEPSHTDDMRINETIEGVLDDLQPHAKTGPYNQWQRLTRGIPATEYWKRISSSRQGTTRLFNSIRKAVHFYTPLSMSKHQPKG